MYKRQDDNPFTKVFPAEHTVITASAWFGNSQTLFSDLSIVKLAAFRMVRVYSSAIRYLSAVCGLNGTVCEQGSSNYHLDRDVLE